jgi:hypothetical protein
VAYEWPCRSERNSPAGGPGLTFPRLAMSQSRAATQAEGAGPSRSYSTAIIGAVILVGSGVVRSAASAPVEADCEDSSPGPRYSRPGKSACECGRSSSMRGPSKRSTESGAEASIVVRTSVPSTLLVHRIPHSCGSSRYSR